MASFVFVFISRRLSFGVYYIVMKKLSTRLLIVLMTFLVGVAATGGWLYYEKTRPPEVILTDHRLEKFYFPEINKATELAGIGELRKTGLSPEDIEIRVWRAAAFEPLEAFILKRRNNIWLAHHLKTDKVSEPTGAQVKRLYPEKAGWNAFWQQITDQGILTINGPSDPDCGRWFLHPMIYVVEINHQKTYRANKYVAGGKCFEAERIGEIGDIIGYEFDTGDEGCKRNEWFGCSQLRHIRKQENR